MHIVPEGENGELLECLPRHERLAGSELRPSEEFFSLQLDVQQVAAIKYLGTSNVSASEGSPRDQIATDQILRAKRHSPGSRNAACQTFHLFSDPDNGGTGVWNEASLHRHI